MHFGEYELFLSLISLSPLPTVHPNTFQRIWVRSSTLCYQSFNLTMGRSLSFASAPSNYIALLRLAFASAASVNRINLATEEQLVGSLCKRHEVTLRLPPLVSIRFQVLFHSLVQGAFHLSLTVLVHYRSLRSI